MGSFQLFSCKTNIEMMIKCMWIQLLITGWIFTSGQCTCDIGSRVTHKDAGIIITFNISTCELILQSTSSAKQIVASLYELRFDCAKPNGKGEIKMFDGVGVKRTLVISSCIYFGRDVSYASRKNALTIQLLPPYKPFKVNVYSIDPIRNFTEPVGIIKSERFSGYYSGYTTKTTPNNFDVLYQIMTSEIVTIKLYFKEFNIQEPTNGNCSDFVKIRGIEPLSVGCGENENIENVTTVTNGLSIEFQTDNINTYTGFEIEYSACFEKRENSNTTEEFHFPIYQLAEEMKCFLYIKLTGRSRVMINMTIHSNESRRLCKDILRIEADGTMFTEGNPSWCKLNTKISLSIPSHSSLILIFTSKSKNEFVNGHIYTEKISEETSIRSSIERPSSRMFTMQTSTSYTGIDISSEENPHIGDTELRTQSSDTTIVIIGASVASVFVIVISIIVLIAIRRRSPRHAQNEREQIQKDTGVVNYSAEKDDGEIYIGNKDYDVMKIKRKHKATTTERSNNTYEATYGPQDVYAVVNRMKSPQRNQDTDEYDDHRFEIVYDKTERLPVKVRDENYYE